MKFYCDFVFHTRLSYEGNENDPPVNVDFIDCKTRNILHSTRLNPGTWTQPNVQYYIKWLINVRNDDDEVIWSQLLDLTDKRVYISIGFGTLGDTIAWFAYIEEFQKKHQCKIITSTAWNELFEEEYPDFEFANYGVPVPNLYVAYTIILGKPGGGDSLFWNKNVPRLIPLQQSATDLLGLEYKPLRPKVNVTRVHPLVYGDYVTISEHGINNIEKTWKYPGGWQKLVDMLSYRYKVVVTSKEPTTLTNIIDMTNRPINDTIINLKHSLAHIGIASGSSWLAWALETPVVMIGGYSEDWHEFECYRVANRNVCNGCYNRIGGQRCNIGTYECMTSITPEMVYEKVIEAVER